MMPGGSEEAYSHIKPIVEKVAAQVSSSLVLDAAILQVR
jgi:6-phosphogluconate dehydrogenase